MDILSLANLLQEHSSQKDDGDRHVEGGGESIITPASFGPPKSHDTNYSNTNNNHHYQQQLGKEGKGDDNDDDDDEIWSAEEIPSIVNTYEEENPNNANDNNVDGHSVGHDEGISKEEPIYQIYFKQEVGTQDVFLGTGDNSISPGSFDCTHIVIKIHFPDASLDELNLDVKSNCLHAESSDKKLSMSLPMQVVDQDGNAQWDAITHNLTVTLPVKQIFSRI